MCSRRGWLAGEDDLMEYVRCNLCGADDTIVRFPCTIQKNSSTRDWSAFACTHNGYGRHPPIVQCQRCGLVYTDPRPDGADILETYQAVEDPLYVEEREGRVLTFERHLKPLEWLTGPPDGRPLLDVGAYTGVFVEIAVRHGWDAWGVEPSRWAVGRARARGLQMVQGTLETAELPEATFDVVTVWDVIEHLTDPRGTLEQAHRLLKPGGLLVVHTIDIESPFARLMGARWPWLMEMHIYYFSRRTLRAMLEACGFRVLSDRPQGRYLRLGYLMNRIGALMPLVGRPAEWLVTKLRLRGLAVPVNLGDLFTAYAMKD
jgi:SAM-dependent methyltransferase